MKAAFKDAGLGANFGKDFPKDDSTLRAAARKQQQQQQQAEMQHQ